MTTSHTGEHLKTLNNIRDISQQGKFIKAISVIVQFLVIHPDHPEGLHLFGTLLTDIAEQLKSRSCNEPKNDNIHLLDPDIKIKWNDIVSDAEKNNEVKVTDVFHNLMACTFALGAKDRMSADVGVTLSALLVRTSIISFSRALESGADYSMVEDYANILIADNRIDEATEIIADGIGKNPGSAPLLSLQARIFDIMEMPDEAELSRLSACVMMINKKGTTRGETSMETDIISKLSREIAKVGNSDEADRIMKTSMLRHPVTADQLIDQGWTLYYSGMNELACETAYKVGIMAPERKDVQALLEKTVFAKTGEPDRLDELLRIAFSSPNDIAAFHTLGKALRDKGRYMEAVAAFRRVLRQKPDYVEAWLQIISILYNKHHIEAAIIMSSRLADMVPDNPLVHAQHGDLMSQSGRPEDAVISYRKAINQDPSIAGVRRAIGRQLLGAGKLKESLSAFYSAVSHDHDDYRSLEGLADAMTLSGRHGDATVWLRRALSLDKNSTTIKQKLAESLLRCGHWDEGKKYLSVQSHRPRLAKPDWDGSDPVNGTLLAYHRPEDPLERTLIGLGVAARMASSADYTVVCECPPSVAKIAIPRTSGISVIEYSSDNINKIIPDVTDCVPLADLILMPAQRGLLLPEWLSEESKNHPPRTPIGNVTLAHSQDKLRYFPKLDKLFNKIELATPVPTKKIRTDAKLSVIINTIKLADAVVTDDAVIALISCALGVPSIFIVANNSSWWWGDHRQFSPWNSRQIIIRFDTETEAGKIVGKVRSALDRNIPSHDGVSHVRPDTNYQPLNEMFDRAESFLGSRNDKTVKVEALNGNHVYRAFCKDGDRLVRIGRFPPSAPGFFTNEIQSMIAASRIGLAPRIIFADVSDGAMVSEFIDGDKMDRKSMKLFVNALSVARMLSKLHSLKPFRRRFDIFDKIDQNTRRLRRNNVDRFTNNEDCRDLIKRIRDVLASNRVPVRSAHNNPLLQNLILRRGKMVLVSWGDAGMSDPHWELSAISVQVNMDDDLRDAFIKEYFEGDKHPAICRIALFEVACCYLRLTEALCSGLGKPENAKSNTEVDYWWSLFKERASHDRFPPALNAARNYRYNP